jgi:hypothetical protein
MESRRSCRCSIGYGILACAAALLSFESSQARAQAADTGVAPAQAVGTAFLKAIQAGDWKVAAAFLDIVPLDHYRLQHIDMARRSRRAPGPTIEQLMRSDSTMPRAVAEYQVQRMRNSSQKYNYLEYEFGVGDPDSLAAMPPSVVAQHWLEVHDPRWHVLEEMKRSNCPPHMIDSLPKPGIRVLGTVVNGPTAYMLYERDDDAPNNLNELQSASPRMLILRRDIDAWWVSPRLDRNGASWTSISCSVLPKTK